MRIKPSEIKFEAISAVLLYAACLKFLKVIPSDTEGENDLSSLSEHYYTLNAFVIIVLG